MTHELERPARATTSVAWAWIAAIAICAYASFLTSRSTLFDRDEPRFAQATVEMIASGNWLVPTFDGELRADKPILVYWLMSLPMRVLGASAWSARFWSPVCLASACLVTFYAARKFFDAHTGLLAMGFLACAPLALLEGTTATTDALLLLCITVAMASLAHALSDGPRSSHFVWLAVAFAAGLLTKGPVGIAVPLLAIVVALWMTRRTGVLGVRFGIGVAIAALAGVAVFLAWAIPANAATGGEFARRGIGHHVVERMSTPLESHGGNFFAWLPFYVPVVALGFLAGTMYLPAVVSMLLGHRLGDLRARALLVAWIVPCFVLMTLVPTKLPHYVLPIWPGLAVASAAVVGAAERNELGQRDRRLLTLGARLCGVVAVILVAVISMLPWFVELDGIALPACVLASVLAVTFAIALHAHEHARHRRAALVQIGGSACAWLVAIVLAMPVVERTKVAPRIAVAIREHSTSDVPLARWKFSEPSLDFYVDRPPIHDFENVEQLRAWAAEDTPALLVIPRDALIAVRDSFPMSRYSEVVAVSGFNMSKGKALELVLLSREAHAEEPK